MLRSTAKAVYVQSRNLLVAMTPYRPGVSGNGSLEEKTITIV